MKPLVSIVIPTYNRARDLDRALKSVLAQTCSDWEVLVVDNHSSDNTDDLVKGFNDSRIKLFKIHNDGVIAASRNLGIKHAIGEYIAFLDSDDWWSPVKLEKSLKYLNQGADVVYHDLYYSNKYNQKLFFKKSNSRQLERPVFEDLIANGNALATSSVVVRKVIMDRIGGLSEERDVVTWEDYDAWIRISKITQNFQFIPECLGFYWRGGGNTSNPAKVIENIEAWERKYLNQSVIIKARCVWATYTKGRCCYLLKDYKSAICWFSILIVKQTSSVVKFKVLLLLIASVVKQYLFLIPKGGSCGNYKK